MSKLRFAMPLLAFVAMLLPFVGASSHFPEAVPSSLPAPVVEIKAIRPVVDSADTRLLRLTHSLGLATDITVAPGGNVQAAINTAVPGDAVVLQADADYVCAGGCLTPNKPGAQFISIKSSRYEEIPVRTFFSTVPTPEVAKLMARVSSSFSTEPVFRAAPGAHHYKLLGLNITVPTGQATRLVELGVSGAAQDTIEEMPHHFVIDKSWIHGATSQEVQRCLALNSSDTDVTNSWLTDCHGRGYDSQAIASWNGGGNARVINNSLSGAGENAMWGGSPPSIPNFVPTNIEFRRNYVWKPASWNFLDQANFQPLQGQAVSWTTNPMPCPGEDQVQRPPRYVNSNGCVALHWTVKNLFELKNARNVIVDGNVFDGNWTDAQAGRAIVFTPRPSDSGAWAVIEDVQFTNNIVRNVGSAMLILGADEPPAPTETRLRRLRVANNFFPNIDGPRFGTNGFFLTVINKTEDVTVEHNTAVQTGNIIGSDYAPNVRFVYRDNISRHNAFGIFGGGMSPGNASINFYFPGSVVTSNVIAKEVNAPSNTETIYPPGNFFPLSLAAVGFVDFANGNPRLALSSPYKGKGSNGSDPGVDMNALEAAIAGSSTPTPSPSPSPSVSPTPSATPTPTPTPLPTPSPSPTATPTPQASPSPSPQPSPTPALLRYEVQFPVANSDSERQRIIREMAALGWQCQPNPSGKFLICLKPKL